MNRITAVHPIQPGLPLGALYYYKKLVAAPPFSHFYQFQCDGSGKCVSAVPDASLDIILECGRYGSTANVYGLVLNNWHIALKRDAVYFGARFLPGYVPASWRCAFPDLIHGIVPLEKLVLDRHSYSIITAITVEMDFQRKVEMLLGAFSKAGADYFVDSLFPAMIGEIFAHGGNITMDGLRREAECSRRYIHKVFQKNIGFAPKTFAMIIQFQKAIQALNRGGYASLSEVASVMGYYDQSRFTEVFKRFTSLTPKQYEYLIRNRKYNSLISLF